MSAGRSTESGYWSGKLGKAWSIALVCSGEAAGTVTGFTESQLYTSLCGCQTSFSCHTLYQLALPPQEAVGSGCSTHNKHALTGLCTCRLSTLLTPSYPPHTPTDTSQHSTPHSQCASHFPVCNVLNTSTCVSALWRVLCLPALWYSACVLCCAVLCCVVVLQCYSSVPRMLAHCSVLSCVLLTELYCVQPACDALLWRELA